MLEIGIDHANTCVHIVCFHGIQMDLKSSLIIFITLHLFKSYNEQVAKI